MLNDRGEEIPRAGAQLGRLIQGRGRQRRGALFSSHCVNADHGRSVYGGHRILEWVRCTASDQERAGFWDVRDAMEKDASISAKCLWIFRQAI